MILPLSLKILGAAAILLLLLLIVWKKQRKILWLLFIVVAGSGIWQGLKEYNRTNKDFLDVKADVKISAADLIHEYETNDSIANGKYLGKIVEVTGNMKKIDKDDSGNYTLVLGDTSSLSSVRCSMDTTHQKDAADLIISSSITLRGSCTGFNKDELGLGSDVILNRCVLISKNK